MAAISRPLATGSAFVLALCLAVPAQADETCSGIPEFSMSLARFQYAMNAPDDADLGMEYRAQGLSFGFTSNRCQLAHGLELVDLQAPDYGDPQSRIYHFLGYRLAHLAGDMRLYTGVRLLTLASGELSFVTPTAGVHLTADRMSLAFDVELPGVFAASLGERPRALWDGMLFSVLGVYQASERIRLEARVRWRDYRGFGLTGDFTAAVGVGMAPVARDGMRGLPGFIGLGTRTRMQPASSQRDTQLLLLVEFAMGAVGDWPP